MTASAATPAACEHRQRFEGHRKRHNGPGLPGAAGDGEGPAVLKVVIPFTDPVIVGRFVYHCHAADHEDKGMMGVVEALD
jgi:FtsP/CotA-like multicopper oxidase with cupredoxin domain